MLITLLLCLLVGDPIYKFILVLKYNFTFFEGVFLKAK